MRLMKGLPNTPCSRLRAQGGQVIALTAVGIVAICAIAGFAIDVGSWYRAHRAQQAVADSAALAAAADLPNNTSQATTDAQTYASKNGGSLSGLNVTYSTTYTANDTLTVESATTAPSYLLKANALNPPSAR